MEVSRGDKCGCKACGGEMEDVWHVLAECSGYEGKRGAVMREFKLESGDEVGKWALGECKDEEKEKRGVGVRDRVRCRVEYINWVLERRKVLKGGSLIISNPPTTPQPCESLLTNPTASSLSVILNPPPTPQHITLPSPPTSLPSLSVPLRRSPRLCALSVTSKSV